MINCAKLLLNQPILASATAFAKQPKKPPLLPIALLKILQSEHSYAMLASMSAWIGFCLPIELFSAGCSVAQSSNKCQHTYIHNCKHTHTGTHTNGNAQKIIERGKSKIGNHCRLCKDNINMCTHICVR